MSAAGAAAFAPTVGPASTLEDDLALLPLDEDLLTLAASEKSGVFAYCVDGAR